MIIHGGFMEIGGVLCALPALILGSGKFDIGQYFSFKLQYFWVIRTRLSRLSGRLEPMFCFKLSHHSGENWATFWCDLYNEYRRNDAPNLFKGGHHRDRLQRNPPAQKPGVQREKYCPRCFVFQKYRFRCPETGCFSSDQLAIKSRHYECRSEKNPISADFWQPQTSAGLPAHQKRTDAQWCNKKASLDGIRQWVPDGRGRSADVFPVLLLHSAEREKSRATMHIPRKAGQQIEVDWAGDPAKIIDPDTGEITEAWIFVGVMTYSQYAFVEAFIDRKSVV